MHGRRLGLRLHMSGIWGEFDRSRAKAAAPVTSTEQASGAVLSSPLKTHTGSRESREGDAGASAEASMEASMEVPTDVLTEVSTNAKPESKANEAPVKEATKEATKETTKGTSETTKETSETTKETTKDTTKDTSETETPVKETSAKEDHLKEVEPALEVPAKSPSEAPAKSPSEAPAKSPSEAPVKSPSEAPAKSPSEAPAKSPLEAPVKSPLEISVKPPLEVPVKHASNPLQEGEEQKRSESVLESVNGTKEPTKGKSTSLEKPETPEVAKPGLADSNKEEAEASALGSEKSKPIKEEAPPEVRGTGSFDYQWFLKNLRMKSADPIARYIKSFLQEFQRGVWTPAQQKRIVSDFMRFISVKLRDFEPFKSMNPDERRNAMEGVEKLITTRLYNRLFPPVMPPILRTDGHQEDLMRDNLFEKKMRLWGWVEGRHLDINEQYLSSSFTKFAQNELGRVNQYKSPRDKLICLLNCSKVIFALIRQANIEQNADSFLPLLIYVVLKCHPLHLVSTLNYIQRFRSREQLRGEAAYYLSTLESAVAFINSLDQHHLSISAEEFDQRMNDACVAESARTREEQQAEQLWRQRREGESSAAVLAASASMLVEQFRTFTTRVLASDEHPDQPSHNSGSHSSHNSGSHGSSSHGSGSASNTRGRAQQSHSQVSDTRFEDLVSSLCSMFPALDREVVADVLEQSGSDVSSAVDLCLALVN